MKASYKDLPAKIQRVGNGTFLYRMNITELVSEEGEVSYTCDEFEINHLTREEMVRQVIADLYGNGVEQKLINDYNAAELGLLDEADKIPYLNYLANRKIIKEQIHADFDEYNAPVN